jgi:hypothetical protein
MFAEVCAFVGLDPEPMVSTLVRKIDGHDVVFTQTMASDMMDGLLWIRELMEDPDCILFFEIRVPTEDWTLEEGGGGTCDIVALFPRQRKIIVADWKYGRVAVKAEWNDQLILYTLGVWKLFGKKYFGGDPKGIEVFIKILQPRVLLRGSEWTSTMKEILKEGKNIRFDAERVWEKNPKRVAGAKQCRYCRAQLDCKEFNEYMAALADQKLEYYDEGFECGSPPKFPDARAMTAKRRSYILLHRELYASWLNALYEAALEDYFAGKDVPRMKMVYGRKGNRIFIPGTERTVKNQMIRDLGSRGAYTRKLLSPSELEAKVGKKKYKERYAEYVTQPDPKPTLVPDTDERPSVKPSVDVLDYND